MKNFNYNYERSLARPPPKLNTEQAGRQRGWRQSQCTVINQNGSSTSAFCLSCFGNINKISCKGRGRLLVSFGSLPWMNPEVNNQ